MEAIYDLDKSSHEQFKEANDRGNTGSSKDTGSFESELASLKEELKYQRFRVDAYDDMISVA